MSRLRDLLFCSGYVLAGYALAFVIIAAIALLGGVDA